MKKNGWWICWICLLIFLSGCQAQEPVRLGGREERPVLEDVLDEETEQALFLDLASELRVYDSVEGQQFIDNALQGGPVAEEKLEEALRAYLEEDTKRLIIQALEKKGIEAGEEEVNLLAEKVSREGLFELAYSLEKRRLGLD